MNRVAYLPRTLRKYKEAVNVRTEWEAEAAVFRQGPQRGRC